MARPMARVLRTAPDQALRAKDVYMRARARMVWRMPTRRISRRRIMPMLAPTLIITQVAAVTLAVAAVVVVVVVMEEAVVVM